MGRPIPEDENAAPAKLEEAEVKEAESEVAEAAEGEEAEDVADTEGKPEFSLEELEAVAGDDKTGWVPEGRFAEKHAEAKRAEAEAERLRAELEQFRQEAKSRAEAAKASTEKPRDFDAELKALKEQYKSGELDLDDYIEKREAVADARSEARVAEKIKPVADSLQQERDRILNERLADALEKESAKWFDKYPFLNHADKNAKNDEAIAKVIAERDELIQAGIAPVKALRLAVQSIAPDYVTEASDPVTPADEVAQRRSQAARKAAIDAANRQPPNVSKTGAGSKETGGKVQIGRTVEDHERYERMTPEQKKNAVFV